MIDPLYVVARAVLLDALDAIGEQRDAVVLVGAQAIYLHTGDTDIAVPAFTTDSDLAIEMEVKARLAPGIVMCREKEDSTSAVLLEKIMADEENHIDWLETQLELMDKLGEPLYAAQCVSRPPS